MEIKLKKSINKWVNFSDNGAKFKVGYPTIEQQDKLNELLFEIAFIDPEIMAGGKMSSKLSEAKKARLMILNSKYYRLYLKYTIKDWEGILDEEGQKIKCKIVDDELYDHYWNGLCESLTPDQLASHWDLINKEVGFTETDKKK